jgi:hypothetical protein
LRADLKMLRSQGPIRDSRRVCGQGRSFALVGCIVAAPAFLDMQSASAQMTAEFYSGKTVKVVIGLGVGGGYDL